jgi:hypothetical protein
VNLAAANWRDETLNQVLPRVQDEFEASLNKGVLLELETGAKGFIEAMVEEAVADPRPV